MAKKPKRTPCSAALPGGKVETMTVRRENSDRQKDAIRHAADRQARLFDPTISSPGVHAALDALDREWKWPLSREDLVRVIISAYLKNAKR
jgi:hypothetical protein